MQSTPKHIISGRKSETDGIVVSTISFVFVNPRYNTVNALQQPTKLKNGLH